MDKEQKRKIGNILFHEHSWCQKDIDDLDMKVEDIIDAYEQTKQLAISRVVGQSEQLPQKPNYCIDGDIKCTRKNECIWCR